MASNSLDVLARVRPAVPPLLVARIAGWDADAAPAEPRRSASVVLIRPSAPELEVYLLHRHSRMAFAASMVVFPGGGLDPADTGPDPLLAAPFGRRTRRPESCSPPPTYGRGRTG